MKKFTWIIIFIILIGLLVFYYINRPAPGISSQTAEFDLALTTLFDEMEQSQGDAMTRYDQKIILLEGKYYSMSGDKQPIIIMQDDNGRMANCQLDKVYDHSIQKGEAIKIKGVFVGYDDLLGEIQLNKCSIE